MRNRGFTSGQGEVLAFRRCGGQRTRNAVSFYLMGWGPPKLAALPHVRLLGHLGEAHSLRVFTACSDFSAPCTRRPIDRANCKSTNASIPRLNRSPYPYHHNFFMRGVRSVSRYFTRTISSSPKRPCDLPMPLALTPPC